MARARVIWPEQWTDAAFCACSPLARLLAIALRNEADDVGLFNWNPEQIKIRLLPTDECDLCALLTELVDQGLVVRYESHGREFGAIKNFCKFQKPKKPTQRHPTPPDKVRNWCGTGTEPVRNWYGTGAELVPPLPRATQESESESETELRNSNTDITAPVGAALQGNLFQDGTDVRERPQDATGRAIDKGMQKGATKAKKTKPGRSQGPSLREFEKAWNVVANRMGFHEMAAFSAKRVSQLAARKKDKYWTANWKAALARAEASGFCKGKNDRGWRANVDWFLRPNTVVELMEGKYDDSKHAGEDKPRIT